jgi:hypothetical protein
MLIIIIVLNNILLIALMAVAIYFLVPVLASTPSPSILTTTVYNGTSTTIVQQQIISSDNSSTLSFGSLRFVDTRMISDRSDVPLSLESGTSIRLQPAANSDIVLNPSGLFLFLSRRICFSCRRSRIGTGAVAIQSLHMRGAALSSSDATAGLQLQSAGAMTLSPLAGLAIQSSVTVTGCVSSLSLSRSPI